MRARALALFAALALLGCGEPGRAATPGPSAAPLSSLALEATAVPGSAAPPTVAAPSEAQAQAQAAAPCDRLPPLELERAPSLTNEELVRLIDPRAPRRASIVVGAPARGALYGGIELPESDAIAHAGGYAWGSANAVHAIERAVAQVRACFPGTPRLFVGDLSREHGGGLRPHASHQAGLDADLGYYYVTDPPLWYVRATAQNLDVPRTRALIRALVEGGNVEMIFIDRSVQNLIRRGKDEAPGGDVPDDDWFEAPLRREALIRHAWGHSTHLHVRFRDPGATALGARLVHLLPAVHPLRHLIPGAAKAQTPAWPRKRVR